MLTIKVCLKEWVAWGCATYKNTHILTPAEGVRDQTHPYSHTYVCIMCSADLENPRPLGNKGWLDS